MDQPWGLTGPEFIRAYLVGVAFAVLLGVAVRIRARTGRVAGGDGLGVTELAYLAGGARRAVELSIARLLEQGKLRASRDGLTVVDGVGTVADRLDQAVIDEVRSRGRKSTKSVVTEVVRTSAAVRDLADGLTRNGFLVARCRMWTRLSALPLAVVVVVGIARVVEGTTNDRPTGYLVGCLALTVMLTVGFFVNQVPARTYAGAKWTDDTREALRRKDPRVTEYALAGATGAVLLGGLASHPDAEVTAALGGGRQSGSGGYGCGGASSCGGGSGCGGGGGCGG
ncbi:TIGR04222 domain-containing membrane protein [Actinokineospora inagensis]|uniref:TIGR04222 domain-containing membrane protein n=1 Tax=Actinokineospora inagensis TaxID=103730 RepID=UPI00047C9971|nr:TIGR04222 domain-containing membrane protein [Actinokineospora inagensis]